MSYWSRPGCVWFCAVAVWGCDERVCADTADRARALPERLSETGLFARVEQEQLEARVFEYAPEYALWSDGAEKRRWVFLPDGKQVDTGDLEAWRFPQGTKLWKEFSVDGVRVETRLLLKTGRGDDDWAAGAYLWRADRTDATLVPYGAIDALGTRHNVPASGECFACHAGRTSGVLGFSAIQLARRSYDAPERLSSDAEVALLEAPLPELDVPGTEAERDALGYLHANCSHCHNQSRAGMSGQKCLNPNRELGFDLDFTLHPTELKSVSLTASYRTAMGEVIEPGDPSGSKVVELMSDRGIGKQMPPLGTERVDEHGLATIRTWIGAL